MTIFFYLGFGPFGLVFLLVSLLHSQSFEYKSQLTPGSELNMVHFGSFQHSTPHFSVDKAPLSLSQFSFGLRHLQAPAISYFVVVSSWDKSRVPKPASHPSFSQVHEPSLYASLYLFVSISFKGSIYIRGSELLEASASEPHHLCYGHCLTSLHSLRSSGSASQSPSTGNSVSLHL